MLNAFLKTFSILSLASKVEGLQQHQAEVLMSKVCIFAEELNELIRCKPKAFIRQFGFTKFCFLSHQPFPFEFIRRSQSKRLLLNMSCHFTLCKIKQRLRSVPKKGSITDLTADTFNQETEIKPNEQSLKKHFSSNGMRKQSENHHTI